MNGLVIKNLHANIGDKEILKGVDLTVKPGEIVALMGPNGSGKSTLANIIMGHPDYTITKGTITYNGQDITELEPEERARKGIFLSFQNPIEIPGLVVQDYLREARKAITGKDVNIIEFRKLLKEKMSLLHVEPGFARRYLNQGFSGGEKKRMEILQMAVLEPTLAVLDETDSGLDIDALRSVAEGVNTLRTKEMGVLVITHYKRILDYLTPDRVVVLMNGEIEREAGPELVNELEKKGYSWMIEDS